MSFSPRKPESLSWTPFPEELATGIKEVFTKTYLSGDDSRSFLVDGRIFETEILLRVGLLESGRLVQNNFEASIDLKIPGDQIQSKVHHCVDALGVCFDGFFEDLRESFETDSLPPEYPAQWELLAEGEEEVYLRYSTVNSVLEKEADRILGVLNEALYREKDEPEDALERAQVDTPLAQDIQRQIRQSH